MSDIRIAIEGGLKKAPARKFDPNRQPRIYPSGAGDCQRKEVLRYKGYKPLRDFPLSVLEKMDLGNAFEDSTEELLRRHYGAERLTTQLELRDEVYSGKIDFVLDHETPEVTIIEHKATGDKWWDYQKGLPQKKHAIQLALYKGMYRVQFGFDPKLVLVYRAWGNYAEFDLEVTDKDVIAKGVVSSVKRGKFSYIEREVSLGVSIPSLTQQYRFYMKSKVLPSVPDESEKWNRGCIFNGERCNFYEHCWDS